MGFPSMLLIAFLLLCLIVFLCVYSLLVWLASVLACFSLGLPYMGLFVPLGLDWLFPFPMLGKYSTIISSKIFSKPFVFLFFFWDPYNLNVGVFDIVPEISETILSSFHYFYFILLLRSYFYHFIFQLTDSFFCFRYSAIDSF